MDIKLENILINPRGKVYLIDWGLCQMDITDSTLLETYVGSMDYACPEVLNHIPYNGFKNDAWSLGTVLYALLHGVFPFVSKQRLCSPPPPLEFPMYIDPSAKDLIIQLLHPDPLNRLTVIGGQKHKWVHRSFLDSLLAWWY
jgi:protein-serine/threonine kinase